MKIITTTLFSICLFIGSCSPQTKESSSEVEKQRSWSEVKREADRYGIADSFKVENSSMLMYSTENELHDYLKRQQKSYFADRDQVIFIKVLPTITTVDDLLKALDKLPFLKERLIPAQYSTQIMKTINKPESHVYLTDDGNLNVFLEPKSDPKLGRFLKK